MSDGRARVNRVQCSAWEWSNNRRCSHPAKFEWIFHHGTTPTWHPVCGVHARAHRRQSGVGVRELAV
jgi:hypothetical protein